MHLFKTLMCLTLLSCSLAAQAQYRQTRDYVGGSFFSGDLNLVDDSVNFDEDFGLNILELRLGVEMARWFHLEGRVGFGVNDKSIGGVEVSINRIIGAYGVASFNNDTMFRPYVLVGVSYGEVEFRFPGFGRSDETESDFSYGVGIDAQVSDGLDLFLEYMQYIDKGFVDYSGIGFGLKFDL